ncbi:MAG: hypothetical protein LBI95_02145 [Holosporales bacterium]|nr:hypothetical protein [Holosporales bacterium]
MVQAFKPIIPRGTFMFEFGRLVQALIGKDEEKEVLKSLKHGLWSIQTEPGKSHGYS